MEHSNHPSGTPYAPHDPATVAAMLDEIGVEKLDALYDIPETIAYDGSFGIDQKTEQEVMAEVTGMLDRNEDLVEFLGRGHYDHYVPSAVDHWADRSEFLTSYTQYQAEASQGFLQALFEYQSILAELTGLDVVNASIYDAATALGEAATLAARARRVDGTRVLVPELIADRYRSVLDNYVDGTGLTVETYPMEDANADVDALAELFTDDVAMVYAESPTIRGTIEESLAEIGSLADTHDAVFAVGSDPFALSVLEAPARVGADIVVGDASVLGIPASYGLGLGLFATREQFLRQVPGHLAGATTDADDNRAYAMVLQTREQHIRRERATSNICTNAAWLALRAAMHAALLGPSGLVATADTALEQPAALADRLDAITGVTAPVHDRNHFREFVFETVRPAQTVADGLRSRGFAVHVVGDHELQACVTETTADHVDAFVKALRETAAIEEVPQS